MASVVEIHRVSKTFGTFAALGPVDLEIRAGEIFALLGPNGAGKTTLISIVAGLLRATTGTVRVLGKDVVRDYRDTRRAIGLVPQEINFDPFFSVEEALRFQAGYFGVRLAEERLLELLTALDLLDKRHTGSRALSGGMKRRLLIGKALVHEPKVLFLDEPTAGVDVELRRSLWSYVRTLRDRGTTIVLTTHYLEEAEELADRIGVIDRGRLLVVEEKEALLRRHGAKLLRLVLSGPVAALPPELVRLGARLDEGGGAIVVEATGDATFGAVLAAAAAAGLPPKDVETRRTTLEDVFVQLLAEGHAPAGAGAAARAAAGGPGAGGRP
ncbi:ABC transporter ATP-binding protein [Anaeromyxobacter oryzisoli]|uniref:ABC transporter ATP-binding protein n=1 Tax=Anaeromyxobacter oryzisoli TaxID=2925408 RepID=UPI001F5ACA44|nr:ABC transporter ATP-binding protein [Anaeromyxobacter sp. SG63]